MSRHETKYDEELHADIDKKLFDTVRLLNQYGVYTQFCCEGDEEMLGNLVIYQGTTNSASTFVQKLILNGATLHIKTDSGSDLDCSIEEIVKQTPLGIVIEPDTYYVEGYTRSMENNMPHGVINIPALMRWIITFTPVGREIVVSTVDGWLSSSVSRYINAYINMFIGIFEMVKN